MNLAHFAPQVVMAPLAMGESLGVSGEDYILSVVTGYEIAARIALSANFWRVHRGLVRGGETPRLVFGANVFGAAVAAGKILGLNKEQMIIALGVCGYFAPSLTRSGGVKPVEPPKYSDAGYMAKYCDAGWSTFTGIMSALYAKMGYIANHYTFDGRYGYIKLMGGESADAGIITRNLSKDQTRWYISDSALKNYPCCKYVHNPLHLFLEIIEENTIDIDEIEKVVVHLLPSHAVGFSEQNIKIIKGMPCTHNIPYNLTMAALKISPTQKWHSKERATHPKAQKLMQKIFTKPSGKATQIGVEDIRRYGFPRRIYSAVEVYVGGRIFFKEADKVKGDPWWKETRFTDRDLLKKFQTCASGVLSDRRINKIIDKVMHIEKLTNISELLVLLGHGV